MGKIDVAFNRCISDNQRFAECFNLLLGEHAICAILGIENQWNLNYAMVVRNYIYEAYQYNEQLVKLRKHHRENKDIKGSEYLAGFKNTDHLLPVLIICVYYGKEAWNAPTHLHELIDFSNFSNRECVAMKNLINDYRLHVLDVRRLKESTVNSMQTDLKHLFGLIRYSESEAKIRTYVEQNKHELDNLDADLYDAISSIVNMQELAESIEKTRKGGRVNMCKALEDMKRTELERGKEIGTLEGAIRMLQRLGKSDSFIIETVAEEFCVDKETVEALVG